MKNWHGIMKIIEIQHIRENKVLWEEKNINNTLHTLGEEFFLKCCFQNDYSGNYPPENYYIGLDNRSTVDASDTIASLLDEPLGVNGYSRKSSNSTSGFTIESVGGVYRANSQIVSFNAVGGSWGPVSKIFISTESTSGILLATASLSTSITVESGDTVNMRMALSLQNF